MLNYPLELTIFPKSVMEDFVKVRDKQANMDETTNALVLLTRMMAVYYGKPVILLVDEYDVPLLKADDGNYYAEMLDVIRSLLGAVKTNDSLKFAVVTGCLRIAKESIFTGTNNFVTDTIMGGGFFEAIGFTENDVQKNSKERNRIWEYMSLKNCVVSECNNKRNIQ